MIQVDDDYLPLNHSYIEYLCQPIHMGDLGFAGISLFMLHIICLSFSQLASMISLPPSSTVGIMSLCYNKSQSCNCPLLFSVVRLNISCFHNYN